MQSYGLSNLGSDSNSSDSSSESFFEIDSICFEEGSSDSSEIVFCPRCDTFWEDTGCCNCYPEQEDEEASSQERERYRGHLGTSSDPISVSEDDTSMDWDSDQ